MPRRTAKGYEPAKTQEAAKAHEPVGTAAPSRLKPAEVTAILASRATLPQSRGFSTPLDPDTGFRRVAVTLTVPSVPVAAATAKFAQHAYDGAAMASTRMVYAVQEGAMLVSPDLGGHWELVPLPETGSLPLQNVFAVSDGSILLQAASPHRPEDPRGHPDHHAPIFRLDAGLRVTGRVQPGRSNWHGPRAIDEAGGTILYAEYPENAAKYRPDFAAREAELRHLCDDAAVYRSADGGRSWTEVLRRSWRDIRHFHTAAADPFRPGTWYVSSGDRPEECHIWRSDDDGLSWREVTADGGRFALHPALRGRHGGINRHTDLVILPDRILWGTDDLLGPPRLYRDPGATMENRVGSRIFVSPKTAPLTPRVAAFVGSHVRSIVDVGPAWLLITEAKAVTAVPRPQVCLLFKEEPHRLVELFTVDRYAATGTGFTYSRSSRAAVDGRFFTYRDANDAFPGGTRILQWDIAFE